MKKSLLAVILFAAAFAVHAQSAEKISQIVDSPELNYGQAAYLALAYSGDIEEDTSESEALTTAVQKNWIRSGAVDTTPINLGELSALYVNATGIKGGLFCRLTKNSTRYSFKELKALKLLDRAADPAMKVSGRNALSLFNSCVTKSEASK